MTTAVILAAGQGTRMGRLTADRPKCMLEIGGQSIIQRQCAALREYNVENIIAVVGHCSKMVHDHVDQSVWCLENQDYRGSNSLYSLYVALPICHRQERLIVLNGDVIFDPALLEPLLESEHDCALLYDPDRELDAEAMKVRIQGADRVVGVAKNLPGKVHGENVGILMFQGWMLQALYHSINKYASPTAWTPEILAYMSRFFYVQGITTGGKAWTEIDFPEDLEQARSLFA